MANVFKNSISSSLGTSSTKVYEAPALTTTTIIGVSVANIHKENISIDVTVTYTSETKTSHLVKNVLLTEGGAQVIVGGEQKLVLETGDYISVVSTKENSTDVVVSVLEIS